MLRDASPRRTGGSRLPALVGLVGLVTSGARSVDLATREGHTLQHSAGSERSSPPAQGLVSLHGTPKTGTTWMEVIAHDMAAEACSACGEAPVQGDAHESTGEWCECAGSRPFRTMTKHFVPGLLGIRTLGDHGEPPTPELRALQACVEVKSTSACVRSSWNSTDELLADEAGQALLVIERDPRAVAVSFYHYSARIQAQGSDVQTAVREIIGKVTLNLAARHVAHKELLAHQSFFVEYNDLRSRPLRAYEKVARVLGVSFTPEQLLAVINRTSMEAMQQLERNGALPGANRAGRDTAKVRQGGDSWIEELDEESKRVCEAAMRRLLPRELKCRYLDLGCAEAGIGDESLSQ